MELWLPVVDYENLYQISNLGNVWSNRSCRLLTPSNTRNEGGAVFVRLSRNGISKSYLVGRLVLEAFEGPCPPGLECCHRDDNPHNNTWPENLRWDTRTNNLHDRVRNGKHHLAIRDRCKNDHEFTPENTYQRKDGGGRACRQCNRDKTAKYRRKAK